MAIKFFDMFAGIGGFRSGLEAIDGFECIGYCEIDKATADKANRASNAYFYFGFDKVISPEKY